MFEEMTEKGDNQKQQDHVLDHGQKIEEWFKLFLNIVEDEGMLKELRKTLKAVVSVEEE